jgi:prepilin-type processing-associated H-X9-DG protein
MKTRCTRRKDHALTLLESLVILAIVTFMVILVSSGVPTDADKNKAKRLSCAVTVKQVGLALRIWQGDHQDKYPTDVSITNGGAMELVGTPDEWKVFLVMSNELGTPKFLNCPADTDHPEAVQFTTNFGTTNISYFFNTGVHSQDPQAIISGDDNFLMGGNPVKLGVLLFASNAPVTWDTTRHNKTGNILLGDGSVQSTTRSALSNYLTESGSATNRFIVP